MRSVLTAIILFFAALSGTSTNAADRATLHEERLQGLDLTARSRAAQPTDNLLLAPQLGDDWQISQTVSPARFDQDRADVVYTSDGGWWVVWDDDRLGSRKIFLQRFDASGSSSGANEMMFGSDVGDDLVDPTLAIDENGRIYLGYRNQTRGTIRMTRFSSAGVREWDPVLVNDTTFASFAGPFDLAVFPDGQLVVVWENYSALGSTITMRIYTPTGTALIDPTTVNSDGGSANHWVPSVEVAPGSGFLAAWEDYRNGQADIYARQFSGDGTPVGADLILIPSPGADSGQFMPVVTYSSKDRYVIGWEDHREGQEIYLQRYNQTTGLVGSNQMISSGLENVLNGDVDLAVFSDGRTALLWSASGADNSIQFLELDSGLVPAGLPKVVNTAALGQRWAPVASVDGSGNLAVAWSDIVDDNSDIDFMLYDSDGDPVLVQQAKINDETVGAHSTAPEIIPTTNWLNLVAFVDQRFDQGDIMVQNINVTGATPGPQLRMNQDEGSALQTEPSLAASDTRALAVWNDGRTLGGFSGQRIFARFMTLYGAYGGNEFLVSGASSLAVKASPRAVLFPDGVGLIAWLDRRSGVPQVYARWLTSAGATDGDEFLVSSPGTDLSIQSIYVGRDATRLFLIWLDVGRAVPTVEVRGFTSNKAETVSYSFSPSSTAARIEHMSADIGPDGSLGLFWVGEESGDQLGFVSTLDDAGSVLIDADAVVTDTLANPVEPSLSISDNGYFSLAWVDSRVGSPAVWYQILDASLNTVSGAGVVSTATPEFMQNPHTDAYRGRAWFVWSDPRADGLNVFADQLVYEATDVDDDPVLVPDGYRLSQNYPNPFNPSTEITYALPASGDVRLEVLNILGQTVTTLVDEPQGAGEYTVSWDGTDHRGDRVASGVYFYRLRSGEFEAARKMMLLK